MSSVKSVKKIPHSDFAHRMDQACDGNPDIPPHNYGRLGWFVSQMDEKFGVSISQETVRRWFAGETRPRHKMLINLAQILKVDDAWLAVGKTPGLTEKQQKVRNAVADGSVNVVAGFVQMCGGHPAFPNADDTRAIENKIDLYAIIRGAQYAFHIVTGERTADGWKISVSVDTKDTVVLGVMPVTDLHCVFVELPWDIIEEEGSRKGASMEVLIPFEENESKWRWIKTFAERL